MKIRIQDNSLRFRLSLREVEALAAEGQLCRSMQVVGTAGLGGLFRYALQVDSSLAETRVEVADNAIVVTLCPADRAALLEPAEEGVYVHREWTSPEGAAHRFIVFVEKDRPGSTCVKKEQWIYDAPPHGPLQTRPIPAKR